MEQEDALDPLLPSERLATAIKWRLEMLEPVIESWPAALAAQAAPENAAATATRVALLADELVGVMGAQGVGLSRATTAAMASPGLQDPIPPEKETNRQTGDDDADADADARGETAEADAQKITPRERDPKKIRGGTVSTVSPSKKPFATAFASAGWYADRAAVAALYGACELFMVGDTSPGFEDTRAFVTRARASWLSSPPPPRRRRRPPPPRRDRSGSNPGPWMCRSRSPPAPSSSWKASSPRCWRRRRARGGRNGEAVKRAPSRNFFRGWRRTAVRITIKKKRVARRLARAPPSPP